MHQMTGTDGETIAVAGNHDYIEVGTSELEAGGKGWGTPVGAVKSTEVGVTGQAAAASDSGNHRDLVGVEVLLIDRFEERSENDAMRTARAEDMGHRPFTKM